MDLATVAVLIMGSASLVAIVVGLYLGLTKAAS